MVTSLRCVDVELETGTMVGARASAEEGARLYHQRFNERRFSDILDGAHPAFKASASRDQIIERMREDRNSLGSVVGTEEAGASCTPFQVTLVLYSKYEKSDFTEFFLFRIRGARADLLRFERTEGLIASGLDASKKCP